jgi:hypothetical protein
MATSESPAHPSSVAVMTNGSTNPYKADSQLGDLNSLFDPGRCQFPTNEEVGKVNSRVVV